MSDIIVEMEGDVHVLKNVTGTKQLREFYNNVVKNNWEKYVGITTQGIRYGFSSEKNTAVRLPDNENYAINPNYRAVKQDIKVEKPVNKVAEKVEVEQEVKQEVEEPVKEEVKEVKTTEVTSEKDYKSEYEVVSRELTQIRQMLTATQAQLKTQTERAAYAEKQITKLMEVKAAQESKITELTKSLTAKVNEVTTLQTQVDKKSDSSTVIDYTTDALIKLLSDKGYKVTITK